MALVQVQWDSHTFQLPEKLIGTVTPALRTQFYQLTIGGIAAAPRAPYSTKLNLLASRFEYNHLLREVNGSLRNLYNVENPHGALSIPTAPVGVLVVAASSIHLQNGNQLALPNPGGNLNAVQRRTSRYFNFRLTANAHTAFAGDPTIRQNANLHPAEFDVAISLPRVLIQQAGHPDDGHEVLIPILTGDVLRNPLLVLTLVEAHLGRAPVLGVLARPGGQVFARLAEKPFMDAFMTYVHQSRYKVCVQLLHAEFLGRDIVDTGSTTAALQQSRQMSFDPATRQVQRLSVDQYYQKFTAVVNMYPYADDYPVDIVQLFWTGLANDLRSQAAAASPPYMPPARPAGETNDGADRRLRGAKTTAQAFERQVDNIRTQVSRGRAPATRGTTNSATAFFSQSIMPATMIAHYSCLDETDQVPFSSDFPDEFTGSSATPNPSSLDSDPILTASVFMSVAEEALQKATGQPFPPLECWGCTDHKSYHATRFHSWRDCPNRNDLQVQLNAKKGLHAFLDQRNKRRAEQAATPGVGLPPQWSNPYSPSKPTTSVATLSTLLTQVKNKAASTWQPEGHPSQRIAELIYTIANPSTDLTTRKACYTALTKRNLKRPGTDGDSEPPSGKVLCFPIFVPGTSSRATSVMSALRTSLNVNLNISQVMPHIRLPIGVRSEASLLAMFDTCAGLNLGRLTYHRDIFEKQPHLVEQFSELKDVANLDEFDIGGVDESGNATKVTAVIQYKTGFRHNGQPIFISFGLSESAATNTIIGLPFIRGTQCTIFMDGSTQETAVSKFLGYTFNLNYQVPLRANKTPSQGAPSTPSAFPVPAAHHPRPTPAERSPSEWLRETRATLTQLTLDAEEAESAILAADTAGLHISDAHQFSTDACEAFDINDSEWVLDSSHE